MLINSTAAAQAPELSPQVEKPAASDPGDAPMLTAESAADVDDVTKASKLV